MRGQWTAMEADGGTVEYWQTCTCNPSDATAYSYVKISAWRTSFRGHRRVRLLNGGTAPRPPLEPPLVHDDERPHLLADEA